MARQEKDITYKDTLFIGVCALGAICAFFFFWKDLNSTIARINDEPIGIITYKYRAAQRRFVERVLWERLKTESPVYSGDTIRTSEQSEATVSLFDGSEIIDLKEKTLIQIQIGKTATEITLQGGAVAANVRSGSVNIKSGGVAVSVGPGAVIEALTPSSRPVELVVQVLEGSAAVTQNGGQRNIAAGEAITLAPAGEAAAVPARPIERLTALSPHPQAKFLNNSGSPLPVNFSWNRSGFNSAEQVILEIAEDRNFNRMVHTLADGGGALVVSLPNGVYWWRAYPASQADAAEKPGQTGGKVSVIYAPSPPLVSPLAGERFTFTTTRPGIRFQWRALPEASAYLVEAAASPAMNNPVFTATVQSTGGDTVSIVHSGFDAGNWYWRVTPVYQRNYAGAGTPSPVTAFTIARGRRLAAPQTLERQETVYLEAEQRSSYFTWRKEAEAASYTFLLSREADLSSPLIEEQVRNNYFVLDTEKAALAAGSYYWGVRQNDDEGSRSAVSTPRRLVVIAGSPPAAVNSERGTVVSEKTEPLQAVETAAAAAPQAAAVERPAAVPQAAAPKLAAPRSLRPVSGYELTEEEIIRSRQIAFSWSVVEGASGYTLTISRRGSEILRRTPLREPSFTLTDLTILDAGEFVWQVTGISAAGLEVETASSRFTVNISEVEAAQTEGSSDARFGR